MEVALDELCKTSEVEGTECMSDVASLKALRISGEDIVVNLFDVTLKYTQRPSHWAPSLASLE